MSAKIQKPAPFFSAEALMPDSTFAKISLDMYKGKYVVLFFYPLDFTFVCMTQIAQFSDMNQKFASNNCVLLGCSIDSKFAHYEYCAKPRSQKGIGKMNFPLISDITKKMSADYGVLLDQGKFSGCALRGTFVIDDKGNLRHSSINDIEVGRNPEQILRIVQALQHSASSGQNCPVNWKSKGK